MTSFQRVYKDHDSRSLCVVLGDQKYEARVTQSDDGTLRIQFGDLNFLGGGTYTSTINSPRELSVKGDWLLGEPVVNFLIDGRDVTVQVRQRCSP